jgi:O-antigen ligase
MLGTGLGHFIPILAYLGFVVACIVSLAWRPLYGLYFAIPFVPYRSLRDRFVDYPLGANLLTILILCVIVGALLRAKHLPKSKLYGLWLIFGIYLYVSMWLGTILENAPFPFWLSDINFLTWKDYMLIPLLFAAASMVVETRKQIRVVIMITACSVLVIDRSCILESLSRTWTDFDESKRDGGPLEFGSNQTAAYLAQFSVLFWGIANFTKNKWKKLLGYGLVFATLFATTYTFSRAGYLAVLMGVAVLGLFRDRKLIVVLIAFLCVWQSVMPSAVQQRVAMTTDSNGQLEASAQARVDLWRESWQSFCHSPIAGNGYATFQLMQHVDGLKDTHNWFVKVVVETGLIGLAFVAVLFALLFRLSYTLFRAKGDDLCQGLGLGLMAALCSSVVTNCFGDRWTYLEITGPLWIVIAVALRALECTHTESESELAVTEAPAYSATRFSGLIGSS